MQEINSNNNQFRLVIEKANNFTKPLIIMSNCKALVKTLLHPSKKLTSEYSFTSTRMEGYKGI